MGKAAAAAVIAISIVLAFFAGWHYSQENYPVIVTKSVVREVSGFTAPAAVTAAVTRYCRGDYQLTDFDASMSVTEDQIVGARQRYIDRGNTCDAISYRGPIATASDGSTDQIYVLTIKGVAGWYIFTFTRDGFISNLQ
jgi:hypothetical protein